MNPTSLAAATGITQPTLHRILTGESKEPRYSNLHAIAKYFGTSVDQLRTGDIEAGDMAQDRAFEVSEAPRLRPFRNVPIVGTVEGGLEGYLEHTPDGDGSVDFPAKNDMTYALRVRGDSMRPRIKSGEFIVVDPNASPNPGDDVVVVCTDGRKMVKELMYIRDGEVTLGSISDGFHPISLQLSDVEALHYVAAIVPRGAFAKD